MFLYWDKVLIDQNELRKYLKYLNNLIAWTKIDSGKHVNSDLSQTTEFRRGFSKQTVANTS